MTVSYLNLWLGALPKLLAYQLQIVLVQGLFLFSISVLAFSLHVARFSVGFGVLLWSLIILVVLVDNEAFANLQG